MPEPLRFKVAQAARDDAPQEFILEYRLRHQEADDEGGDPHVSYTNGEEKFVAYPTRISEVTVLEIAAMPTLQDAGPIFKVFQQCMEPPEYKRFFDFCQHPDHLMTGEDLNAVMQGLIEAGTAHPTQQPSH